MTNSTERNIEKYGDLQDIIRTKTSSTLYFEGERNNTKVNMRLIIGYDKKEKKYFTIGDPASNISNKQEFIRYISEKLKELGFKSKENTENKIVKGKLELEGMN